jgi:hypothetical protein
MMLSAVARGVLPPRVKASSYCASGEHHLSLGRR